MKKEILKMEAVEKKDDAALLKEVAEIKQRLFDSKQKLLRGELKEVAVFKVLRKNIARMLTVLNQRKKSAPNKKEEKTK